MCLLFYSFFPAVQRKDKGIHLNLSISHSFLAKRRSRIMAFDHPVEADRVDLSFTSIIARAPVIGSLMYLLGGQHAREEEEYHSRSKEAIVDFALASDSQNSLSNHDNNSQRPIKSALKKSSPSLAPTDECSDRGSFQSALDSDDRHGEIFDSEPTFGRKKKELSWSDESGQNLVQYIDALPVSQLESSFLGGTNRAFRPFFTAKRALQSRNSGVRREYMESMPLAMWFPSLLLRKDLLKLPLARHGPFFPLPVCSSTVKDCVSSEEESCGASFERDRLGMENWLHFPGLDRKRRVILVPVLFVDI